MQTPSPRYRSSPTHRSRRPNVKEVQSDALCILTDVHTAVPFTTHATAPPSCAVQDTFALRPPTSPPVPHVSPTGPKASSCHEPTSQSVRRRHHHVIQPSQRCTSTSQQWAQAEFQPRGSCGVVLVPCDAGALCCAMRCRAPLLCHALQGPSTVPCDAGALYCGGVACCGNATATSATPPAAARCARITCMYSADCACCTAACCA
jgi:hypothetical protein